jgi:acyl-CoA synthetase (NDP forming)
MALAERVGFSRVVSRGNKADVDEVTLIRAWDRDLYTGVILAYVEGIERGREFLEVARQVTRRKPIIAIKAGSTAAGSRAVSSHTGTLAGSEAAYEAAFRQSGVIRVRSVQELFDYAVAFGRQPPLVNGRIAIVTNAGGPGIMATDACERAGLQLAPLSQETMEVLRCALPAAASVLNPIDLLGDAPAACYGLALDAALADPQVGGVLVILTPQAMTEVEATARIVGAAAQATDKPVLACFMGRASVESGVLVLEESGVPNYPVPERAVAAFAAMARQQAWSEEPPEQLESFALDRASISAVLDRVRADGRVAVGDLEGRQILAACGIPVPRTFLARTPAEAVLYAEEIGFPVAVKLSSPDILHKTDLGGVQLGVSDPQAVREAFEQMTYRAQRLMPDAEVWGCLVQERVAGGQETVVIMNRDPHFGPLLAFRLGSVDIQALRDQAYRIAPFDRRAAREMIREARAHDLMSGAGGRAPADVEALVDALLRLGQVATDYPEIAEFEADPLVVQGQGQGLVGVDMRLVLAP